MSEPTEKPIHRIFDGQLKLCETSNPMLRKVVLMLLNDTVCRNNWLFERIEEHLKDVAEIPILYSVINGKIANGHDFEMVRDANGKLYPSFIGANCEHPAGWIKETEDGKFNPHIENIDGKNWIVAVGTLWVWYNRELIEEIERNGGQMNVSIEADVYKNRIVDGVEYEEEYRIVGVTILGTGVPPAFAGANIRKLSASIGELEQLKIRAASYEQVGNSEPQTQNNKNLKKEGTNSMDKLKVKDLTGKFPGFKVLAVQDENVLLLSEKGDTFYLSSARRENGEILCGSKAEITPVILFANEAGFKIELPVATITESLQARCAELQKQYEEEHKTCQAATTTLTAMQAAEKIRRRDEATNAIKARLAQINADRPENSKFKEEICANLLTAAAEDKYTELVDAEGKFIGASMAARDVDALCMEEQIKLQAEEAKVRTASATKTYAWEQPSGEPQKPNAGILGAISRVMK